uniref:TSA: Wollemia nobilis Ref_Wollemi_Transcript_15935_939 transcribed RNA sequence n=1 Tax=Wollemia nobilis TaxID=56998 RepID=A0A0C9RRZ7_9CONI
MACFSGKQRSEAALCMWAVGFMLSIYIVAGREFTVGGKNGWATPTGAEPESYNQWADRLRFHVGDTLVFKYPAKQDSVLVVTPEAFQKCNTSSPAASYDDGNTVFKFPKSGPFYFVSGSEGHCEKGQKLVVVVMTSGGRSRGAASAPAVAPVVASPALSPAVTVPADDGPAMSPFGSPAVAPTSGAARCIVAAATLLFSLVAVVAVVL